MYADIKSIYHNGETFIVLSLCNLVLLQRSSNNNKYQVFLRFHNLFALSRFCILCNSLMMKSLVDTFKVLNTSFLRVFFRPTQNIHCYSYSRASLEVS